MSVKANQSRRWRIIIPLVLLIIVIGIVLAVFVARTQAAPEQPIAFNHEAMVQLGITCLFCHSEARTSDAAGIPAVERCNGCHKTINPNLPVIQQVNGYWTRQEPIPWVRVNVLPRYVYFSHEVHVNGGQNCENCHGDVGHMGVDYPVVQMNMGWCLSCHEKQPDAKQLIDCVICHR